MSGKLLNLSVQDWLWRGYGALMRALPRFGAHCQRSSLPKMFSHTSSTVCAVSHAFSAAVTRRTAEKTEMTKLVRPVIVNLCFADCS